jgi:uncharacterized glyoxalase superfamily protein PhnB
MVKPIPDGYSVITPYLLVKDSAKLIDFLKRAFGAQVKVIEKHAQGKRIMHAQVTVGDSRLMMGDVRAPWKPTTASFYVYVKDTDATYRTALKAVGSR